MWNFLLDLFFPRRSIEGTEGEWVTPQERRMLTSFPVIRHTPVLRSVGLRSIDRITAASSYGSAPLLRKAIYTFKYGRVPGLTEDLGQLLVNLVTARADLPSPTLCPVPLHWSRKFQRGFNQAELLANIVARERGLPIQNLLRRTRATGHQAWRKRGERRAAVRSAFRALSSAVPPYIILIDDLSTTGATLDACASALKKAGAKRVEAIVIAQG